MASSGTGSGTYPAILRAIPSDPALRAEFQDLLSLLALACGVPMAGLSVMDGDRVSIVAAHGQALSTHTRTTSLCELFVGSEGLVVVPDVLADPRVSDCREFARESGVRLFAGVPVIDACGRPVGTLFVCDREPRDLDAARREALTRTASRVAARLGQRADERVAERLRLERDAVIRKLDLHQTVVSNMDGGVMVLRAGDERILYANPTFERMFGYGPGELEGRPAAILNSPRGADSPTTVAAGILEQLQRTGNARGELLTTRKDGTDFWSRYRITTLDRPGEGTLWITVQEDVSERHEAERALHEAEALLRQSQRMEAIGRLAGWVSHEFNNLLTTILGHSELALLELSPEDSLRQRLAEIRDASQRAAGLTHQLLAFSGRQILQPRSLDLVSVIRALDARLRHHAGPAVQVAVQSAAGRPWAKADPRQLENVLLNLVSAARERMPGGGRLVFSLATEIDSDRVPEARWAIITARDTGPTPDPDHLARVFEPFHGPPGSKISSGLSLAVVYGVVTQSGGQVSAAPVPGGGLEIRIALPASSPEEARLRPDTSRTNLRGTETILLVEDEDPVRGLVRQILAAHGYAVIEAASAVEALQLVESRGILIGLVLSDIVMPGKSGRELAEQLKREHPRIPVLLMSGYDSQGEGPPAPEEAGTFPFIAKPFRPKDLARMVRGVLDAGHGTTS
ncbi:MAG: response regulator [Planctomycetes bacterium]|nr:response regulator [Planctomycetota bacterium]